MKVHRRLREIAVVKLLCALQVILDVHFVNTLPVDATLWGVASFPRKRESRRRAPWGLDARVRGHDVLLTMALWHWRRTCEMDI